MRAGFQTEVSGKIFLIKTFSLGRCSQPEGGMHNAALAQHKAGGHVRPGLPEAGLKSWLEATSRSAPLPKGDHAASRQSLADQNGARLAK